MSNLSSSEEADETLNVLSSTSDGSSANHQEQPLPSPGNPDPSTEVIALSPRTLMATNRFICEVCNKGFQREQNLQLHMRGHNSPWKLKQKTSSCENKNQVYICPEISGIHHNPACALGDLKGIKKHFSRKHGEKKWKCDKCSKKYAVQSEWEAHSKTCGTKEYKCDCGTIFSRKDRFVTHRAFCDALAKEVLASSTTQLATTGTGNTQLFSELVANTSMLNLLQINNSNMKNPPIHSNMVGSMFSSSSSSSFNHPGSNSSNLSSSATLLLQQAAQMGTATVSSSNMSSPINNVAPKSYASPFNGMQIPIPSDRDDSIPAQIGSNNIVHGFVGSVLQNSGEDHHQNTLRLMQIESGWYNNANNTLFNEKQRILNKEAGHNNEDGLTPDFLGITGMTQSNLHEIHQQQEINAFEQQKEESQQGIQGENSMWDD